MSEVNALIPLSGNTQGMDVGKMLSLAEMAQQMRIRNTQMQNQNALSQLLASPQAYNPDGTLNPDAQRNVNALNPEFGLKYRQQQIDAHFDQLKEKAMGDDMAQRRIEASAGIADSFVHAYQEALKTSGGNKEIAMDAATKARNAGLDLNASLLGADYVQKVKAQPGDLQVAQSLQRFKPGEIQEERLAETAKLGERHATVAEAQEAEREKTDRARIAIEGGELGLRQQELEFKKKILAGGGKAPAGYEWKKDEQGNIAMDENGSPTAMPIPGGPKDPTAQKPWTGREKVFTERTVAAANNASLAIKNITQLPVGASTGLMGIGGHAGTGIFTASGAALRNKLSSQETQDYNTMLAGVRRNLATVETMGMMPQGTFTESMGSLELRPGDSDLTRLRKLAEMRQIVERGMDIPMADPAVPKPIKDIITKVVDEVKTSVPFTQEDVTKLENNPNQTLAQLTKAKGLGAGKEGTKGRKLVYDPATGTFK